MAKLHLCESDFGYKSDDRYYGGLPAEPEYDGPPKRARYYKELIQYFKEKVREYPEYFVIGTSPTAITLRTPDGKETIDLTKFDALSDADEAIEMASHYFDESLFEAKKKKKNGALVNPDAVNVEHSIAMFNKMNSPVDGPCNNPVSGPMGGDVCAESLGESNNSYLILNKTIVEDTELPSKLLSSIRNEFKNRGQLRIGDKGVRFVAVEDDFAQYISRENFDNYIRRCLQDNMYVEDIVEDIPWEHTISIHHWFETEKYNSDKRDLDLQYGFAKKTTHTVQSNNQKKNSKSNNQRNSITFTDLKKQKAAIVPYVAECMNILRDSAFRLSVKVISPSNCFVVVTVMGGVSINDIRDALRDVQAKFPGELTVSWGTDCSDWRLSRYNVQLAMSEDTQITADEMLTEEKMSFDSYVEYDELSREDADIVSNIDFRIHEEDAVLFIQSGVVDLTTVKEVRYTTTTDDSYDGGYQVILKDGTKKEFGWKDSDVEAKLYPLTEAMPPKKETIELEYKNLEFTQYGTKRDVDDWDEWDRCMDWTYEVDKDDLYTFIFESCIDETDFPEAFEDEFDPNNAEHWARFESWLDDNFDTIYSKYEDKILENWEEDAAEEAADEYDPDDYVDWDSMPGGHDDDRYWEDLNEGEEVFMEKYSYGLNEEYKREPRMIDYFEQMNSEEDEA